MLNHRFSIVLLLVFLAILFFSNASIVYYILVIVSFLLLILWGSFDIRSNYFTTTICKSSTTEKVIALTFDDGPHEKTEEILDVLLKHNVKATFFCIGKQIEKYPKIAERIINEQHVIGNHSYSHSKWNGFFSTKKMISEIQQNKALVAKLYNKKMLLFRPPFGVTNPNIARAVSTTNQVTIGWNIRSLDTVLKRESLIFQRIKRSVQPGSIILLHDTSEKTVNVLEQLLLFLQVEGYQTKTVEELLNIKAYEN